MDGRFEIPGVTARTPLGEAAPAILLARARALFELEAAARNEVDADVIHDLRVASRRLREAMRLLAPVYGGRRLRRWRGHVRDLTSAFGPVRDADVFIEALAGIRPALGKSGQRAAAFLAGYALGQRSRDLTMLLSRLPEVGLTGGRERFERDARKVRVDSERASRPLNTLAHDAIAIRVEAVEAARAELGDDGDPAAHHDLRIAFKKLRYAAEVFAPCYGDSFDELHGVLKSFQDALGDLHDIHVFSGIIEERYRDGSAAGAGVSRADLDAVLAALAPLEATAAARFTTLAATYPPGDLAETLLAPLAGAGD